MVNFFSPGKHTAYLPILLLFVFFFFVPRGRIFHCLTDTVATRPGNAPKTPSIIILKGTIFEPTLFPILYIARQTSRTSPLPSRTRVLLFFFFSRLHEQKTFVFKRLVQNFPAIGVTKFPSLYHIDFVIMVGVYTVFRSGQR